MAYINCTQLKKSKGEYIVITGVRTNGFIVSVYPGGGSR